MIRLFFFSLILLLSFCVCAQELMPPVINHSTKIYGAASQNWGISSDENGVIYVANKEGLLRYDGQRWELFKLPNKTIIRSVFSYKGKIYTGSYEEFGYWEQNEYGSLKYTSLTHLIKSSFNNEEFWQIIAHDNGIAFRSFGKLYIYQNGAIKTRQPDFLINSILSRGDKLYLGSNEGKLFILNEAGFTPVSENSTKNSNPINCLTLLNDEIFVGTRLKGIYKLSENQLIPWPDERLNKFLSTNELNKIEAFDGKKIVFGTIKGGVLSYDINTGEMQNYHRGNGLQNNTVLALKTDKKTLWIGLDNGIDEIDLNAPITYYSDKSGELGAVYDVAYFNNKIYLASNTGAHILDKNKRNFIPGSQGQVWNFSEVSGHLLANHNQGVFEVKDSNFVPITESSGSYRLDPIPNKPNFFLNSTYNGLQLFEVINQSVKFEGSLESPNTPIENIVFQNDNTLWAAHPYKGFFKLSLNLNQAKTEQLKSYGYDTIFTAYKTKIHKIKNEISFFNAERWFRYNAITDSIERFKNIANYDGYSLISEDPDYYWFKNREGNGLVYTNFTTDSIFVYEPLLENHLIKGHEKVIKLNDSIHLITLNEGYASVNLNRLTQSRKNEYLEPPTLNKFSSEKSSLSLLNKDIEIPNEEASQITIQVSAPSLDHPRFVYKLSNKRRAYSDDGIINLQNLSPTAYNLKIWSIANGNLSAKPLNLNFTILPPWYFNNWMKSFYLLLVLGCAFLIFAVNKRKLNKHRRELEQKVHKEQERKIQLAERNKLLDEINTKRKELANTTYLAAKRNRTLMEVKNELDDVKDKFDNQYKFKNIQTKINHIIEGKDNWKVFETNFNEINDDFFHDLLKKYPSLSTKDLKLCAYLKMNMSTKEIAPLMAISARGVEIHRYRLRKKLNLKSGKNLSKFLISNY